MVLHKQFTMNNDNKNMNKILALALPLTFFVAIFLVLGFALSPIVKPLISQQTARANPWELEDDTSTTNRLKSLLSESKVAEAEKDGTVLLQKSEYPVYGEEIGTLIVDGTAVDARLFYGDGNTELNFGAGIYADAHIPGEGGTVLVAGHTATFFRDFENAEIGEIVTINTFYGEYCYEITDMKVAEATDTTAYDLTKKEENIIMYTCYPFNTLGYTKDRYFIYGKLISGPALQVDESKKPAEARAK